MCAVGQRRQPDVTFVADDVSWCDRRYDLVLCSSSLQYVEHWELLAKRLARAADPWLYVSRLPVVEHSASFVAVLRAHKYGYDAQYLGWVFNRGQLRQVFAACGLDLVREFFLHDRPLIWRAPEDNVYSGFLFHAR